MDPLKIILLITSAFFAFIAGWLKLTENARFEVFKRKLDIYQTLNKLASDILLTKVASTTLTDVKNNSLAVTGDEFSKHLTANSILISSEIFKLSLPFVNPTPVEPNDLRIAFNKLSNQMVHELKLSHIHKINEKLFTSFIDKLK